MATDGPDPPPCDPDIFKHGVGVCVLDGPSNAVERWVKLVAKTAKARVDWHYSGGRANVLHLGDKKSRQRVLDAIKELEPKLKGRILSVNGPTLYRADVDTVPEGTIAVDPDLGPIVNKLLIAFVLETEFSDGFSPGIVVDTEPFTDESSKEMRRRAKIRDIVGTLKVPPEAFFKMAHAFEKMKMLSDGAIGNLRMCELEAAKRNS
jgi:hypothetical protein